MNLRNFFVGTAVSAAFLTTAAIALQPLAAASPTAPRTAAATDYVVQLKGTQADAAARKAITRAGGTITGENTKLGYATVTSRNVQTRPRYSLLRSITGLVKP